MRGNVKFYTSAFTILVFSSLAHSALSFGDAPTGKEQTASAEQKADAVLYTRVTDAVNELNRRLVTKYLGHPDYIVSDKLNEPIRQLIDFLMKPLQELVSQHRISNDLSLLQVGGITGAGKSQILRDYHEWRKELGLIKPDDRFDWRNGDPKETMDLTIIDRFGMDLKLWESRKLDSQQSFKKLFDLYLDTTSLMVFDEASHFMMPNGTLEEVLARELEIIRVTYTHAKDTQRDAILNPKPKNEPDVKDFRGDFEGYRKALIEYSDALYKWQIAENFREAHGDPGKLKTTLDGLMQKRSDKYQKDQKAQKELYEFIVKLWSATSGGIYMQAEETEQNELHKQEIEAAQLKLRQFHAKYEHSPILTIADGLLQEKKAADERLRKSDVKVKELDHTGIELKTQIEFLDDLSPKRLQEWAEAQPDRMDLIKKTLKESHEPPACLVDIIREVKADAGYVGPGAVGHKPNQEVATNGDIASFKRIVLDTLRQKLGLLEHERGEMIPQIKLEQAAVVDAEFQLKEEGTKSKSVKDKEGKQGTDLVAELDRLTTEYHLAIDSSLHTSASKGAVLTWVRGLSPKTLAEFSPDFSQRLTGAFRNKPETWIEHMKEGMKQAATNPKDIEIAFTKMLELNPETARGLIYEAVTKFSVNTNGRFLGNQMMIFTTNVRKIEAEVKRRIAEVKRKGTRVTANQYSQWYQELLLDPNYRDWPNELFTEHFPGLFDSAASNNAGERRLQSPRGPVFIGAPEADLLLNHVTTTMKDYFDEWIAKQKKLGFEFRGNLFVHENVPANLVRDDAQAEKGPNVSIDYTRQVMGDLLTQLAAYVQKQYKEHPGTPVDMNIAFINEKLDGKNNKFTFRALHPDYNQGESKILRGEAAEGNWASQTNSKIKIAEQLHHARPSHELLHIVTAPEKPVVNVLDHEFNAAQKMFADWKAWAQNSGMNVQGDLFIHEYVPGLFVTEGMGGPVLDSYRMGHVLSTLLKQLTDHVEAQHKQNSQNPHQVIDVNVGLFNERLNEHQNIVRFKEIDARAANGDTLTLKGNPADARWSREFGRTAWLSAGYNHDYKAVDNLSALRQENAIHSATVTKPRQYIFEPQDPAKYAQEKIPATRKEMEDIATAAETQRKAQELTITQQNNTATEQTNNENRAKAKEAFDKQTNDLLKQLPVWRKLADPTQHIEEYYKGVDEKLRDTIRDILFQQLSRIGKLKSTPTQLYLWLRNEHKNGINVDKYIAEHFDQLRSISTPKLMSLFSDLVLDANLQEELFESFRPNGFVNIGSKILCAATFGKATQGDVPKSLRNEAQVHSPWRDFFKRGSKVYKAAPKEAGAD